MKPFQFLILVLTFLFFFVVRAQETSSVINIQISPQNPEPGNEITLLAESYSIDLNKAKINWKVNGIDKQTGIGLKKTTLIAGEAGKPVSIKLTAETTAGQKFEREISFTPAGVDLIYEALTYTPPFYKGRALNTNQSDIIVVAFPEIFDEVGRKYNTSELIFNWEKDGAVIPDYSGPGKNYLTFSNSIPPRDSTIKVTATVPNKNIIATKTIEITRQEPKIIIYENSPIYGIMTNRAITNTVNLLGDEFSVLAIPYFYSVGYQTSPDLKFSWSMNGGSVETQEPKNNFTVRQEVKGSGIAKIGLKVNNVGRIFQYSSTDYDISFSKE